MRNNREGGFTLIELLVVVAILGLISTLVAASLSSSRTKSRDAKRMQDLAEIRKALAFYYDANGECYPSRASWVTSFNAQWSALETQLNPYMSSLPKDPKNNAGNPWTTGNYSYGYYTGAGTCPQKYDLIAQLENTGDPNICTKQCWRYHSASEQSWCVGCPAPTGNWSPYLYADH